MQTPTNTNVERIIAKIDNDFNPDNSDWIPRVAAWTIDVLNMLDVNTTKKVRHKLPVNNRIVKTKCCLNPGSFKIIGQCGRTLKEVTKEEDYTDSPSTGEVTQINDDIHTTGITINGNSGKVPGMTIHMTSNSKDYKERLSKVIEVETGSNKEQGYYVVDHHTLEMVNDCDYVIIEINETESYFSEVYNCELPIIPNNGKLIEAIAYFCLYKMLCRGYKHPVFNLSASQYGTNPYYIWTQLKDEAKRSIAVNGFDDSDAWKDPFFTFTFDPKYK